MSARDDGADWSAVELVNANDQADMRKCHTPRRYGEPPRSCLVCAGCGGTWPCEVAALLVTVAAAEARAGLAETELEAVRQRLQAEVERRIRAEHRLSLAGQQAKRFRSGRYECGLCGRAGEARRYEHSPLCVLAAARGGGGEQAKGDEHVRTDS